MITGHHPSGYLTTHDASHHKVEQETRSCSHCQYTWVYRPGSGHQRGFCLHCMSVLCGKPACQASCAPFSEAVHDPRYILSPEGVFVK